MSKPIIFNAESVKAILDGRKTQTRRVIKPQPYHGRFGEPTVGRIEGSDEKQDGRWVIGSYILKRTYEIGDELWVREKFKHYIEHNTYEFFDGTMMFNGVNVLGAIFEKRSGKHLAWKSPIFMPKSACRIFLKITDIRVERVQDITIRDAEREGIHREFDGMHSWYKNYLGNNMFKYPTGAILSFQSLWDSINEKRGFDWDKNPWVFVIEFERIK